MKKVIILHGWTKTLDKWKPFLNALKEKGVSSELLKIPGLTGDLGKVWRLENYIEWLRTIINQENSKVILIGHSNGGRIALAFTNQYPQKVEKLILIDSAGIRHNELPLKIKRIAFRTIAKIGKKLTSSEKFKDLLYKLARESDYKNLDPNVKQTMTNLISANLKPILQQIKTPTLIVWGANDKITPLSDGILINKLIKNSELKIIESARHSPMLTNSEEVANIIYEYI